MQDSIMPDSELSEAVSMSDSCVFCALLCAQLNNPYHLWQLWRADVRHAHYCLKRHNHLMDCKVARLMKCPPPEHTIAGVCSRHCVHGSLGAFLSCVACKIRTSSLPHVVKH